VFAHDVASFAHPETLLVGDDLGVESGVAGRAAQARLEVKALGREVVTEFEANDARGDDPFAKLVRHERPVSLS